MRSPLIAVALLGSALLAWRADATRAAPIVETIRIPSPRPGLQLALHHEFLPGNSSRPTGRIVLFAEGSAVPTAGNAGFKISGLSWMDDLARRGFDVWALDYLGYGDSDRYPPTDRDSLEGTAAAAADQVIAAARFTLRIRHAERLSLIGDSFGTLVAGVAATRAPDLLDHLVLFAPVTPAAAPRPPQHLPPLSASDTVTPLDLWRLYLMWLPPGASTGLDSAFFLGRWGSAYLATDPSSGSRMPPSVIVPGGPDLDDRNIAAGVFPYDPGDIRAPTLVIAGEWDTVATDVGGRRLFAALTAARWKRRVVVGRGTHIVQLERERFQVFDEVRAFLLTEPR